MSLSRLTVPRLTALFGLLGLGPLVLLAYLSITLSTHAVENEVISRVDAVAAGRADAVEAELSALVELVESYAGRRTLIAALHRGDAAAANVHLSKLRQARGGIAIAFLARPDGVLTGIAPRTPGILGKDFSFRDWYRGLSARGRPYVSEAYVTQASGHERVVAAATYVRPNRGGAPIGILVAGYRLDHLQDFVDRFHAEQGVRVTITDQRGILLVTPGGVPAGLRSAEHDPAVAAALRGDRGAIRRGGRLVAYTPVPGLGWTVTTSVPEAGAFAAVRSLRTTVLGITGVLALVLAAGIAIHGRALSRRAAAERRVAANKDELEAARTELEHQNAELEAQTAELEDSHAQLEEANDELEVQQLELERTMGELTEEKERVEAFFAFARRIATETDAASLARVVLTHLADFGRAEVGTIYVIDDDGALRLAGSRGVDPTRLPDELASGGGLAGRALQERRLVSASYGEAGLRLAVLGEEVPVRHELHVPLVQGDRALGVVTLARLADRDFAPAELEAIEHLGEQSAVALANALSYRRSLRMVLINDAVLNAARDAIRMTDLEGRPVLTNARFRELTAELGLPADGTSEERMAAVVAIADDPSAFAEMRGRIADDSRYEGEHELGIAESGRSFRLYTAPVLDATEQPIGRLFVVRETTVERQAERLKSELVATVSHELRTPLASIVGFSELMTARTLDEATRARYVRTIHDEAERLSALIDDFLDVQRIEAGAFRVDLVPVDLGGLLRNQVDLFAGQSEQHELRLDLPHDAVQVVGERDRIAQVVANLVSNAIKYSPAGGVVDVAAERRNGTVRVSVRDAGLGIPADEQSRIFTKFFRVDSSDTRTIGGTGLGLALAREIIDAHGGRIGFESVEGNGSTFWFELPAELASVAP